LVNQFNQPEKEKKKRKKRKINESDLAEQMVLLQDCSAFCSNKVKNTNLWHRSTKRNI